MKERIVYLANAANVHTRRFVEHFSERYCLTVLSFEEAEIKGAEVVLLKSPFRGLLRYLWVVPFVRSWMAQNRPAFVHAHYAGGYGLLAAFSGFHPFVLSVWGSDIYQVPKHSRAHRLLVKFMLAKADHLCSTSAAMAIEAKRYLNRDYLLTPFGIDLEKYQPFSVTKGHDSVIIGTVKKLDTLYGVDRLLRAFALLCEMMPQLACTLLIVGDGEERENLQRLALELGIASRVNFHGRAQQEDVPELLARMKVYVALSRSESFGVAILEASSCGVPVVVSDAGGLPEVVVDGVTGFVVKDGDPELAALAIKRLVEDNDLLRRMGIAGREHVVAQFAWEHTIKPMERLYSQLIGRVN